MRIKCILLGLLACLALAASSQPAQQNPEWEWYLGEVVKDTFVGRNYFEYYYTPSAADMEQQRIKGEVSYFLNSPDGLNSKKVRDMIDRLMASYDDIKAVGEWHMTTSTYWKEFRYEQNKFRFSVKRKALEDGTYYVSATETAGYYKSLGKSTKSEVPAKAQSDTPSKRSTRHNRKQVTVPESDEVTTTDAEVSTEDTELQDSEPVMSEKQRRQEAREQQAAERLAERDRQRHEQEKRREEAKAQKEAEKLKKAEEKKKREEEKQLKKEEEKRQREQARLEREKERQEKAAARQQASAPKVADSKFHCSDVALWLSEKYDFTQTGGDGTTSCSMYSTAVKEVEMAKLAIKNALKGSNARMAVPWRLNSTTGKVETGYTVDGHVLVFAIGKNDDGHVTLDLTEVSAEQFEQFKQSLNDPQ